LGLVVTLFARPTYDLPQHEARPSLFSVRPLRRTFYVVILILVFLRELVTSSLRVAWYVLQPTLHVHPGIIAYPLDVKTDREITALANLISLTPGTLSLDVSEDRSTLYIHAMQIAGDDPRTVRDEIKNTLERHVARALGPADSASADERITSDPHEAKGTEAPEASQHDRASTDAAAPRSTEEAVEDEGGVRPR
jgi:multicomponent Na+:H+ antiporter subunit E